MKFGQVLKFTTGCKFEEECLFYKQSALCKAAHRSGEVKVYFGKTLTDQDFVSISAPANTQVTISFPDGMKVPVFTGAYTFKREGMFRSINAPLPAFWTDEHSRQTSFRGRFCGCTFSELPEELFKNNPAITDFSGCFAACKRLNLLPADLFSYTPKAGSFSSCFARCSRLTCLPIYLFSGNPLAKHFSYCFSECKVLHWVPPTLFLGVECAENFDFCFSGCSLLTVIEKGLFRQQHKASFIGCFSYCSELTTIEDFLPQEDFPIKNVSRIFEGCKHLKIINSGVCRKLVSNVF